MDDQVPVASLPDNRPGAPDRDDVCDPIRDRHLDVVLLGRFPSRVKDGNVPVMLSQMTSEPGFALTFWITGKTSLLRTKSTSPVSINIAKIGREAELYIRDVHFFDVRKVRKEARAVGGVDDKASCCPKRRRQLVADAARSEHGHPAEFDGDYCVADETAIRAQQRWTMCTVSRLMRNTAAGWNRNAQVPLNWMQTLRLASLGSRSILHFRAPRP
jgi:hypothetical protein